MTLQAILYTARGDDKPLDLNDGGPDRIKDHQLLWIDIDARDPGDLRRAAHAVGLEDAALRRLQRTDRRARILRLPERVVLTIGAVEADDPEAIRYELDIVVGLNHVITVHDGPLSAVTNYGKEISEEREVGRLDAAAFTAGVLDAVFAAYFRQIEAIERDIDALDEIAVRTHGTEQFLDSMLAIRRRIARLRRALAPNREALLPLARPDFELRQDLGPVWPGIVERLERAIDSVENARDLLIGSFDLYQGRNSQQTNDVMKALTLISAILLPGIILAGVMGMNFKLDFFEQPSNFFVVIAGMVASSLAILLVARWRHWV